MGAKTNAERGYLIEKQEYRDFLGIKGNFVVKIEKAKIIRNILGVQSTGPKARSVQNSSALLFYSPFQLPGIESVQKTGQKWGKRWCQFHCQ
jgi:hypothetical protein